MRSHAAVLVFLALFATPVLGQQQTPAELSLDEKLSLSFQNTRLETVLGGIQDTAKINLVADPAIDTFNASVTTKGGKTVGELLDAIQSQLDLERTVWSGAIYLYPQGEAPPEAQAYKSRALKARVRLVNFKRATLSDVITRLRNRGKQEFAMQSFAVRKHMKKRGGVTLRLHRARLGDVLNLVCRSAGLTWKVESGKVAFGVANPKDVVNDGDEPGIEYSVKDGDRFDKMPDVDVDKLVRQLSSVRMRGTASRMLIREGKPVVGKVAAILKTAEPSTQMAALQVLAEIGDPSPYASVLAVFKNAESLDLRTAAGGTLGAIKAPEAVPALIEALSDPWFKISETARHALISIGTPSVGGLLAAYEKETATRKGRDGIIYRALLALGEIGDKQSKKALLRAIRTTKGSRAVPIRHHAAIALGMTDDVRLVEPLIAALKRERDFRVAKYIARSLSWITDHDAGNTGDRWEIWWELKGRKKLMRKNTSDKVIDGVGGEVRLPLDEHGYARLESDSERLTRLIGLLGDKDRRTRSSAWRDLESMGELALPSLKLTLVNGNPKAKANAKAIIARIEEKAGLEDE